MQSVQAFLAEAHNREVMARLLAAGVAPSEAPGSHQPFTPVQEALAADASKGATSPRSGPLAGKTVVVTGTLSGMSRTEAEDWIRQQGGSASGSVSRRTDFVLAGDNAGSKLERAQALGVPVIDLQTLLSMGSTS
jgi:DNA ligase (NAD+)